MPTSRNFAFKIAANRCRNRYGYYWHISTTETRHCSIQWYHRRSPKTYRLATLPRDWHSKVRNDPLRALKVDDFCVIW